MAVPALAIILGFVGVGAALAFSGSSRYALSSDCQTNLLRGLDEQQLQAWLTEHVSPNLSVALSGRGTVRMTPVQGEPVPQWAFGQVASCHGKLIKAGLTPGEATALCRIEGRNVWIAADAANPGEIAAFLYQQVVPGPCAVMRIKDWAADKDAASDAPGPDASVVWPSRAAECVYASIFVATKLELLARTGDAQYQLSTEDLAKAAEACAEQSVSPGGGRVRGVSVGRMSRPQLTGVARQANAGLVHPAHVLNGSIFR